MAQIFGGLNKYLLKKARWYSLLSVLSVFLVAVAAVAVHYSALLCLPVVWYCYGKWRSYQKGLLGERSIMKILSSLDDSYTVFNDVTLPGTGGNIDHVLVGTRGVFAIETKNYSGCIACTGDEWARKKGERWVMMNRSPSKQAKYNASMLKNFLKRYRIEEWVTPVVVFVDPAMKAFFAEPTVDLIFAHQLKDRIAEYEEIWSRKKVEKVSNILMKRAVFA
jgi:hypothetical protein